MEERPEYGAIVKVEGWLEKQTPYWLAYTMEEGGHYLMVGCPSEEHADSLIKRYKEDGTMVNPRYHIRVDDSVPVRIRPYSLMKLKACEAWVWVPDTDK